MTADRQRQEILKHIARDELAALTRDLVDIPSPTGHEREIGEFILDWYARHGTIPAFWLNYASFQWNSDASPKNTTKRISASFALRTNPVLMHNARID